MGKKIARELGGTFKIRGDRAVLAQRGAGMSASGAAMPTVVGQVGANVSSWSISPRKVRDRFKKSVVRYFDRPSASFKSVEVETGDDLAVADRESLTNAADAGQAEAIAEGRKSDTQREGGEGSVELDLAAEAQAEGTFILTGARPGVDGSYRIVSVTHKATRGGGSTTSLELKQPGSGAGQDERAPGSTSSSGGGDFALPAHGMLG